MTAFGKQPGRGLRSMALEAIGEAILDSGLDQRRIERIYFGNAIAPTVVQQDMIKGRFHPLVRTHPGTGRKGSPALSIRFTRPSKRENRL